MDRSDYLEKLRNKDHEAFAEFVDHYQEKVFLCCYSFGLSNEEAEDIASETFLAAYQSLPRFEGKSSLSTWLWTINYRQIAGYLRKKRGHVSLDVEANDYIIENDFSEISDSIEKTERDAIIWATVKKLPVPWAFVITLYYRENQNINEIASIMEIPPNTVKTYLFRAKRKLKKMLNIIMGETI